PPLPLDHEQPQDPRTLGAGECRWFERSPLRGSSVVLSCCAHQMVSFPLTLIWHFRMHWIPESKPCSAADRRASATNEKSTEWATSLRNSRICFSPSADQLPTHEGGGREPGEPAGHGRRLGHGLPVDQLCALDARRARGVR